MVPAATSLKCLFTGLSTATSALADALAEAVSPKGIRRRDGHRFLALLLSSDNICVVKRAKEGSE